MNPPPSPSPTRVLVTGSSGFVGRTLLVAAARLRPRAAVRQAPPGLSPNQVAVGDIDENTDWSNALAGMDHVVHLAAHAHVMKPSAQDRKNFERINVIGTERLARAAAASGVKRFVYLSSIKVNGECSKDHAFRAEDTPDPRDDYARSKLEAERRLSLIENLSGMTVSIIRSPLVYGPGVRANFHRLLSLAHSGLPVPLAAVANARSMVSVWNLCDLICTLIEHEQPMSGVWMVSDGEDISTAELVRRLARLMGRPARLFSLPVGAMRGLAALTGRGPELDRLCNTLAVDISATRTRLGWTPPLTLEAGLERTVRWYMQVRTSRTAA